MPELVAWYVGPDQVMPVMSVLAAIVGFLLIFWNRVLSLFRRILGLTKRSSEDKGAPHEPEK